MEVDEHANDNSTAAIISRITYPHCCDHCVSNGILNTDYNNTENNIIERKWLDNASKLSSVILQSFNNVLFSNEWTKRTICVSFDICEKKIKTVIDTEQRTKPWHLYRNGWVKIDKSSLKDYIICRAKLASSSIAGDLLGHKKDYDPSDYQQRDGSKSIFGMMTNAQRGTAMEPMIRQEIQLPIMKFFYGYKCIISIQEVGLQICKQSPFVGVSSDGMIDIVIFLYENQSIEYVNDHYGEKRATLKTVTINDNGNENISTLSIDGMTIKSVSGNVVHIKTGLEMKCRGFESIGPYGFIPHEYFDQISITMHVTGLGDYWFTCHSKDGFELERYVFNKEYWSDQMKKIEDWYWSCHWPLVVLIQMGFFNNIFYDKNNNLSTSSKYESTLLSLKKSSGLNGTALLDFLSKSIYSDCNNAIASPDEKKDWRYCDFLVRQYDEDFILDEKEEEIFHQKKTEVNDKILKFSSSRLFSMSGLLDEMSDFNGRHPFSVLEIPF